MLIGRVACVGQREQWPRQVDKRNFIKNQYEPMQAGNHAGAGITTEHLGQSRLFHLHPAALPDCAEPLINSSFVISAVTYSEGSLFDHK
jgi:hypothetical protein